MGHGCWDRRLSWLWICVMLSSGTWRTAVWYKCTDVSKGVIDFLFRIFYLEDEGSRLLPHVGRFLADYTKSCQMVTFGRNTGPSSSESSKPSTMEAPKCIQYVSIKRIYEACPESKDTKVLKIRTTFLIYKSDTVNELLVHNFIFQHSRRHCPNIY